MKAKTETAALLAKRGGSNSVSIFSGNPIYQERGTTRKPEYPVAKIAQRFCLPVPTAKLICHLSGIGRGVA